MKFKDSPFRVIAILYLSVSLLFTFLYLLPLSLEKPLSFWDSWFLSASAMSTTGLSTIDISEHLTLFGKTVLLIQIQMGGIGIMAIVGILLLMFGQNVSLSQQTLMSFDQNQKGLKSIKKLMIFIFVFTFSLELIGLALFYPIIHGKVGDVSTALFMSFFQSVSSFTGAGFDLFGGDITMYATHSIFMITSAVLIFCGAIGFPTILELLFSRGSKKSLYTKINISMHGVLLGIGFIFFFLFEYLHTFSSFSLKDKLVNAFFLSVTSRNAGLTSIDLDLLSLPALFLLLMLMFIGGSASSSAGGIRVTTFAVLLAKMRSIIKGQEEVVLFKKSLYEEDVNKSFLVFFLFFGLFSFSVLLLSFFEETRFESLLFEVMSALTNTGLSIGITDDLSIFSQMWLSVLMIVGRIGIIALLYSFIKPKKTTVKYTKEHLIVG